jgi:tetratricopeptide (TPR) repeat protein
VLSAAELHRRALVEGEASRYGRARALLLKALERDPAEDVKARIELSLAYAESERGSVDDGLLRCEQALGHPNQTDYFRALVRAQQGLLYMRAGRSADALQAFTEAEPGLFVAEQPEELTRLFLNRGNVYLQRGDVGQARTDFEGAIAEARRVPAPVLGAKAEHNLGYVELLTGDLPAAVRRMDQARPVIYDLSRAAAAICDQDRAEVLVAAGLTEDAVGVLRSAVAALGSRSLRQQQAEAELVLARLLLMTDELTEARRVARQAARRFRQRGSDVWALRADLLALGAELASRRRIRDVEREAAALEDDLNKHGLRDDARIAALLATQASVRSDHLESATARLRRVRVADSTPIATRMLARQVRAELALRQNRRAVAMRQVRDGIADLHSWQSSFGSLDLQTSLVGHGQELASLGLSMAVDDGRPEVVFEWFERARALASRVVPVRPPEDRDAAAALTELRQIQVELRQARPGAAKVELSREATRLREQIRQRSWYGAGADLVIEPATLDGVQETLARNDGALISYVAVDGAIHAVVVTEQSATVHGLGPLPPVKRYLDGLQADLDVAASQLPKEMRAVVVGALHQRLTGLSEALWAPLADVVADRPAVIVPPGALVGVPWSMLPGLGDRPLTAARSASAWLRARDRARPRRAGLVSGPDVPRAEEEVRLAAKAWEQARVLAGPNAVAAEVSALAAEVDVLHVASHGRHAADNPLFSGLDLVDGPWFGYDIDRLPRVPSTVVLSACELGRSAVRWGAETIGMTVAWLHAGTDCVIASPARVADDTACDVLAHTHEGLATGQSPAVALAEARAQVDAEAIVPFICFGAGW